MFSCKTIRLNLNWRSGGKDAVLPDLSRVRGFANCTGVYNLKASEAAYSKVANFLVDFSVFFRRSEEHQKFVAESS